MNKIHDSIIFWQGFGNGFGNWNSSCRVRIYQGEKLIVLFSDLDLEGSGTSITNCIENICTLTANFFKLRNPIFIEHYPRHIRKYESPFDKEEFSLVKCFCHLEGFAPGYHFEYGLFKSPSWVYISKFDVEAMIGDTSMNNVNSLPTINLG